jgi:endo-1,4-beta-xylanase
MMFVRGTQNGSPVTPLDVSRLPDVRYWNDVAGEQWDIPNPFIFLDGSPVDTPAKWQSRYEEIKEIVQFYEYGYLPVKPDGISYVYEDFSWERFTMRQNASGERVQVKAADEVTKGMVIHFTRGNKSASMRVGVYLPDESSAYSAPYPAVICLNTIYDFIHTRLLLDSGYAVLCMNVNEVYNEATRMGAINDLYGYDWEKDLDAPSSLLGWAWGVGRIIDVIEQGAYEGIIARDQFAVTGHSRYGKGTLVVGAFEPRIGVVNPVASGSGGVAMERFISSVLKAVYFLKNNKVVLPHDDFDTVHVLGDSEGSTPRMQTLAHAREEQTSWFNLRFQEFAEHRRDLRIDDMNHGVLSTMPFDQHFVTSLIAPRGLLIGGGIQDYWTNAEGMAFNYLATAEVYKLLGIENKIGIKFYNLGHRAVYDSPGPIEDLIEFSNRIFRNIHRDNPADFHIHPYPLNDERSDYDYLKLNWAAPGSKSIAGIIRAYP